MKCLRLTGHMNIDKRAELHITTNVYYRYMINTELYNTYDAESYNMYTAYLS